MSDDQQQQQPEAAVPDVLRPAVTESDAAGSVAASVQDQRAQRRDEAKRRRDEQDEQRRQADADYRARHERQ